MDYVQWCSDFKEVKAALEELLEEGAERNKATADALREVIPNIEALLAAAKQELFEMEDEGY